MGAKAQQTLSFVYDASGNRAARVIIMSSIIATGEEPSEEDEAVQTEENLLCQSAKMTLLERGYSSWQHFCTNGDHCTNPAHQYRTPCVFEHLDVFFTLNISPQAAKQTRMVKNTPGTS